MDELKIKDSIKYFDNYCTNYRIVIDVLKKGLYVDFKVYEVDEELIENMESVGLDTFSGKYAFGAFVSYKHIFPHYGEEKESSGKYHLQLGDLEELQRWHDTIYNICEIMKRNYC